MKFHTSTRTNSQELHAIMDNPIHNAKRKNSDTSEPTLRVHLFKEQNWANSSVQVDVRILGGVLKQTKGGIWDAKLPRCISPCETYYNFSLFCISIIIQWSFKLVTIQERSEEWGRKQDSSVP